MQAGMCVALGELLLSGEKTAYANPLGLPISCQTWPVRNMIGRDSGFVRGIEQTIYKHFSSKEALFVEIVTSMTAVASDTVHNEVPELARCPFADANRPVPTVQCSPSTKSPLVFGKSKAWLSEKMQRISSDYPHNMRRNAGCLVRTTMSIAIRFEVKGSDGNAAGQGKLQDARVW